MAHVPAEMGACQPTELPDQFLGVARGDVFAGKNPVNQQTQLGFFKQAIKQIAALAGSCNVNSDFPQKSQISANRFPLENNTVFTHKQCSDFLLGQWVIDVAVHV